MGKQKRENFVIYESANEIIVTTKEAEEDVVRDWFKAKFSGRDIRHFKREEIKGGYAVLIRRQAS